MYHKYFESKLDIKCTNFVFAIFWHVEGIPLKTMKIVKNRCMFFHAHFWFQKIPDHIRRR